MLNPMFCDINSQFDNNPEEMPYEEEDLKDLYNIDQIISSLEAQTNEPKKGFG